MTNIDTSYLDEEEHIYIKHIIERVINSKNECITLTKNDVEQLVKAIDDRISTYTFKYLKLGLLDHPHPVSGEAKYSVHFKELFTYLEQNGYPRGMLAQTVFKAASNRQSSGKSLNDHLKRYLENNLYNHNLSIEENLENGNNVLLFRIHPEQIHFIEEPPFIPDEYTKCLTVPRELLNYGVSDFRYIHVDPHGKTAFALRDTNFLNYSKFLACDERVLFEVLLFKWQYWKRRKRQDQFFYGIPAITEELGIKKDRAKSIIKKFENELGIISTRVARTKIDGQPRQVTWIKIHPQRIIELLPLIFREDRLTEDKAELLKNFLLKTDAL